MKFYLITYPEPFHREAEVINELFSQGMDVLHVRKPGYTEEETKKLLNSINIQYHSKIALHQHHSLVNEFKIQRVHFSERARLSASKNELNEWKKRGYVLSTSIHSVKDADQLQGNFDYVFLGPVFESISKPGYKSGADLLHEVKKEAGKRINIVAIGGIAPNNIDKVKEAGFEGVAVLGAIWSDPSNAVKIFNECRQGVNMF